ncbi:uncharacterized protein N7483_007352 [Penicillium malachiteum]|uniref:uncharacterized protein n=1 Tax=Penicillium malachiteum TaxID=1324776 RepID=UPI00254890B2|nr:uncharacterized protein N7483_007352 [Penicillium malachiteum]KAJ5725995.1 hypothetical protein N7483_007352 [Penicillium malachiteum]
MASADQPDIADTDAMELHSYFAPGLPTTDEPYTLQVTQTIECANQQLPPKESFMKFIVDAPRFTLPAESIHSVYPAEGVSEQPRVLPHIVFNDPQLPWERVSKKKQSEEEKKANARPPWLALMVFTNDELQVRQLPGLTDKIQNSSTRALSSTVGRLAQADQAQNDFRCPNLEDDEATDDETSASYILLSKERFQTLISHQATDTASVTLDHFKYFSHVRVVNVEGSSHATKSDKPDKHPLSVVFSHRTAPVDVKEPQTVFVHLISLDGILDGLEKVPLKATDQQIGLLSLYSWTYRVAPADHISYHDLMQSLDDTKQPLRRPNSLIDKIATATDPSSIWLAERLRQGYTWMRHRTMSGETTVGLYRGPLTPKYVEPGHCEPTIGGKSLQIVDAQAGVVDLSYSIAWELGRNLAIADKGFTAAMLRLRTDISTMATDGGTDKANGTFKEMARGPDGHTKNEEKLYTGVYRWANMAAGKVAQTAGLSPPAGKEVLINALQRRVRTWLTDMAEKQAPAEVKNEKNPSASTDWLLILQWVKDKLALKGIPYIYLFPDPATLPLEALRTFYVDENWTDALIDGALSIANHSTLENDPVKREIRGSINHYLSKAQDEVPSSKLTWRPRWGLLMRSKVIEAYPNLRIARAASQDAGPSQHKDKPAAFSALASDTLIYYQPDTPEADDDAALVISQPFHHQRFSVGDELNDEELKFSFKLFGKNGAAERAARAINEVKWTVNGDEAEFKCNPSTPAELFFEPVKLKSIYDWKTRCINPAVFIDECQKVNDKVLGDFKDAEENSSAYMGVQLNDTLLMLRLKYPNRNADSKTPPGGQKRILQDSSPDLNVKSPDRGDGNEKLPLDAPQFFPEPSNINPGLLPPTQGFKVELLGDAVVTIDKNVPSYNNLLPLTTSQLAKVCYPRLPLPRRHFPAGNRIKLDVIFSINAIPDIRQDIHLRSLTVYIPVGRINTNLLLPLEARPNMKMIGPGRFWILSAAQVTGKRHRINLDGTWIVEDACDDHDQQWLAITVSPVPRQRADGGRRARPLHLIRHPQLSFLLHEVEMNSLSCERIPLLVEEHYYRATDEETYDPAGTVRTVVGVTKQSCEWK